MPWDIATCDFLIGQHKWETDVIDTRFTAIWWTDVTVVPDGMPLSLSSGPLAFYTEQKKFSLSIHTGHQFKPLPQCVTQGQRQSVDVAEDDVKWKRELLHVGFDFWQFSRVKYRHSDVKYRVFVGRVVKNHENHEYAGLSCTSNGFMYGLQGETPSRVNYSDFDFPIFHVLHHIA